MTQKIPTKLELIQALVKYARHSSDCYDNRGGDYCTCGLNRFFPRVGNWGEDQEFYLKKIKHLAKK